MATNRISHLLDQPSRPRTAQPDYAYYRSINESVIKTKRQTGFTLVVVGAFGLGYCLGGTVAIGVFAACIAGGAWMSQYPAP